MNGSICKRWLPLFQKLNNFYLIANNIYFFIKLIMLFVILLIIKFVRFLLIKFNRNFLPFLLLLLLLWYVCKFHFWEEDSTFFRIQKKVSENETNPTVLQKKMKGNYENMREKEWKRESENLSFLLIMNIINPNNTSNK